MGICVLIFLVYLTLYFVSVRITKVSDFIPQEDTDIKDYGFYRRYFYIFGTDKSLYMKQCDDKERDFLRLKYLKLPRYRAFFWKWPSIFVLILITIMTIGGIITSAVNFNGKLAWYLFDLYHMPVVAEKQNTMEDSVSKDASGFLVPIEVFADENRNEEICMKVDNTEVVNREEERKQLLESCYIRNVGDPSNLYIIDDNGILWGAGRNDYGQLALGLQDYGFHTEMSKIAENVIHVDFSQERFMIYLTDDNRLYGVGNAGCGALQQYDTFEWDKYVNGEKYAISSPYLLMEDVQYAICGRDDVVAIKTDGTVWTWGTICINGGYLSSDVYYVEKPIQVLENATIITGGWFNHAALLADGTVWTWGYNSAENCGVLGKNDIREPVCVAENVAMVWTGNLGINVICDNILEFDGVYPRQYNNTVIQKTDGSIWACGENIGTVTHEVYGSEGVYSAIYSGVFHKIDSMNYFIQSFL